MAEVEPSGTDLKYKRILLKISGEALMGSSEYGIDMPTCLRFAQEISDACETTGAEICLGALGDDGVGRPPTTTRCCSTHASIRSHQP